MKDLWSNLETFHKLMAICDNDPDELRDILIDTMGYDEEMIYNTPDEDLEDILYDDLEVMQNLDNEEFEGYWFEAIQNQTFEGIILLGEPGNHAVPVYYIPDPDWYQGRPFEADEVGLVEDNGNLFLEFDEQGLCPMYAIPRDKAGLMAFIEECMSEALEDQLDRLYWDNEDDPEYIKNDMIEAAKEAVADEIRNGEGFHYIDEYCDFSKVPEFCQPIQAPAYDATMVDYGDNADYQESLMPQDNVIEALSESIDVDKENAEALQAELDELKAIYENDGLDEIYGTPFHEFWDQFPVFYQSCLLTFLRDYLNDDPDQYSEYELEELWCMGGLIQDMDWEALFKGAEEGIKRANSTKKNGDPRPKAQWEKVYPQFVKDFE